MGYTNAKDLLAQSKVVPELYPYPNQSEGRWQLHPALEYKQKRIEELDQKEEGAANEKTTYELVDFEEKYIKMLEDFQVVQQEVISEFID